MFCFTIILSLISIAFAQNAEDCGTKGPTSTPRIVGGTNAQFLAWPWQGSLQRPSGSSWYHSCGCSIIGPRWVVTAAHCTSSSDPTQYRIRLGEHDRSINEGTEYDATVRRVIRHPGYNSQTIDNDVSVLELSQPLNLTTNQNYLGTICVGKKGTDVTGRNCVSTGWGNLRWQGSAPNILQQVTVQIADQAQCRANYTGTNAVTDGMICSGIEGKGTCQGDSGGPLQCLDGNVWTLYGATSWALQCALKDKPSVACRIAYYEDWIWDNVNSK